LKHVAPPFLDDTDTGVRHAEAECCIHASAEQFDRVEEKDREAAA
jgi:hypothetical protein